MGDQEMKKKKPLTVSECDDHLATTLIQGCWMVMEGQPTVTKMKTCYNLTAGVLRLFCVQGTHDSVIVLLDEFSKRLKEDVDEIFKEK